MFNKIAKRMRAGGHEGGFTLIELLVVIIIIGILAAIAIPMYLSQRTKGWEANAKSDLRNAAVAEESYYTDHSTYATALADVEAEGYNKSANINFVDPIAADASGYCLQANHTSGGNTFHLSSSVGEPEVGACP